MLSSSSKSAHRINIVFSTEHSLQDDDCTLQHLFDTCSGDGSISKVLIRGPKERLFLLWFLPIDETSAWSVGDAVSQAEKVLRGNDDSGNSSFLFRGSSGSNYLAVVSRFTHASAESLSIGTREKFGIALSEEHEDPHRSSRWFWGTFKREYVAVAEAEEPEIPMTPAKSRMIRYLAIALCLFFLLAFGAFFIPSPQHPWQRFSEVDGSTGPRYQLQLKPNNVTEWVSAQKDVDSRWFLRIDDGSVYPKNLLEEKEIEYQEWLYDRYPEVNWVRTSGSYLSPEYLHHSNGKDMLIDKYFHISHCVHSMRRYWMAKETGMPN